MHHILVKHLLQSYLLVLVESNFGLHFDVDEVLLFVRVTFVFVVLDQLDVVFDHQQLTNGVEIVVLNLEAVELLRLLGLLFFVLHFGDLGDHRLLFNHVHEIYGGVVIAVLELKEEVLLDVDVETAVFKVEERFIVVESIADDELLEFGRYTLVLTEMSQGV